MLCPKSTKENYNRIKRSAFCYDISCHSLVLFLVYIINSLRQFSLVSYLHTSVHDSQNVNQNGWSYWFWKHTQRRSNQLFWSIKPQVQWKDKIIDSSRKRNLPLWIWTKSFPSPNSFCQATSGDIETYYIHTSTCYMLQLIPLNSTRRRISNSDSLLQYEIGSERDLLMFFEDSWLKVLRQSKYSLK